VRSLVTAERLFVLLLFVAVACSSTPTAPPSTAGTGTHVPTRRAVLHDLVSLVFARDSTAVRAVMASDGQMVPELGEVRTGSSSTARLDFSDGGSVRLAPNTSIVIDQLGGTDSDPFTRLKYGVGELWVSLIRGQLEAQTPVGVVAVRGSYAELQYDPGADPNSTQDDVLTINCIEGTCTFNDGSGPVTIGNLRQLVISDGGQTLSGPTNMPASAVDEFLSISPESTSVVLTLTAAAVPSVATAPSATDSPVPGPRPLPSDTATTAPIATDTAAPTSTDMPRPTPTRTPRPHTVAPTDTAVPSGTPLPSDTPLPPATDTSAPPRRHHHRTRPPLPTPRRLAQFPATLRRQRRHPARCRRQRRHPARYRRRRKRRRREGWSCVVSELMGQA
jgi:hypothetical protein